MDLVYRMQRELIRRKYSPRTLETYTFCVKKFLKWLGKEPKKCRKADVKKFLTDLAEKKASAKTLNVYLQAIKFALGILNRRLFVELPCAKTGSKLPEVLTKYEILQLISAIKNPKHKLIVSLMYSAGLRVSELTNLRVKDLDLENNIGWVRSGKGNKDRPFIIAQKITDELTTYIKGKDSEEYLFTGQKGSISTRTVQEILKTAGKRVKTKKRIHPHLLRHSFATHVIEDGNDVATLQSLLGHSSSETTMIYVHIAKPKMILAKSPLDIE